MNTDLLRQYAMSFIGTPYIYGGKTPMIGLDCSGLVSEVLRAANILKPHESLSAQQLFDKFQSDGNWNVMKAGSLAFYGKSNKEIDHVAFMIDSDACVEAAGGDVTTTTMEQAILQNAFVKIRSLKYRGDLIAVVRPKYQWELLNQ